MGESTRGGWPESQRPEGLLPTSRPFATWTLNTTSQLDINCKLFRFQRTRPSEHADRHGNLCAASWLPARRDCLVTSQEPWILSGSVVVCLTNRHASQPQAAPGSHHEHIYIYIYIYPYEHIHMNAHVPDDTDRWLRQLCCPHLGCMP
jgi:hypothetical protein